MYMLGTDLLKLSPSAYTVAQELEKYKMSVLKVNRARRALRWGSEARPGRGGRRAEMHASQFYFLVSCSLSRPVLPSSPEVARRDRSSAPRMSGASQQAQLQKSRPCIGNCTQILFFFSFFLCVAVRYCRYSHTSCQLLLRTEPLARKPRRLPEIPLFFFFVSCPGC